MARASTRDRDWGSARRASSAWGRGAGSGACPSPGRRDGLAVRGPPERGVPQPARGTGPRGQPASGVGRGRLPDEGPPPGAGRAPQAPARPPRPATRPVPTRGPSSGGRRSGGSRPESRRRRHRRPPEPSHGRGEAAVAPHDRPLVHRGALAAGRAATTHPALTASAARRRSPAAPPGPRSARGTSRARPRPGRRGSRRRGGGSARSPGGGLRALAHLVGRRGVAGHAGLEQLGGALAVEAVGVLRPQRRRGDGGGALLRGQRRHPRRRRVQARRRHGRRDAARVERGDRGLADAERLQRLGQVVVAPSPGRSRRPASAPRASLGVKARTACCTRWPSWASTSSGRSVGSWVMKNTPTPFERIRRTVRATASRNAFEAPSNSRWASSKKKTSTGFSGSPDLGQRVEQLRQHPHQERREERRARAHVGQVEHRDDAAAVGRRADQVGDLHLRLAEERRRRPRPRAATTLRRSTPAVALEMPPIALSSALPGPGEVGQRGAQVLEVDQRQALLVAEAEDRGRGSTPGSRSAPAPSPAGSGRRPSPSPAAARRSRRSATAAPPGQPPASTRGRARSRAR